MWGYFYIDFERVFAGGSMSSDSRLPSTYISISNFLLRSIYTFPNKNPLYKLDCIIGYKIIAGFET